MTTTTKTHEKLGELYIETICQNAYYEGAARTIRDAVVSHITFNEISCDLNDEHCRDAAAKLTRDAMGFMERTISLISDDQRSGETDWARIDAYFNAPIPEKHHLDFNSALDTPETRWMIEQLNKQSERACDAYTDHAKADWAHDVSMACVFLKAAALILNVVVA